jgi:hypothetical protein
MKIPRQQVLDLLKQIGRGDVIAEACKTLPDPIDLDHHENLLSKFGLGCEQMIDRFGGSP